MKYTQILFAVLLVNVSLLNAFAESNAAPDSGNPVQNASTSLAVSSQKEMSNENRQAISADPPAVSRGSSVTGFVLGVDPHAHIITMKSDHSVDGIRTGDKITVYKGSNARRKVLHHENKRTLRRRAAAPKRSENRQQAPAATHSRPAPVPPASSQSSATTSSTGTGANALPENENSGSATATTPPSVPTPANPVSGSNATDTNANPVGSSNQIGIVPRGSSGPGGTLPGGLGGTSPTVPAY